MNKLTIKNIEKSIKTATNSNHFENLQRIYRTIPQGRCHGCTKCCMESVQTHYTEFLNVFQYLQGNRALYEALFPKLIRYYFLELVEKSPCPFLNEEGMCMIYNYRPLVCRLFGHWTEDEYEASYRSVHGENLKNARLFRNKYGIDLPKQVVEYKIQYCEDFEVNKRIQRNQRQNMVDNIFTMESAYFMRGLITEDYLGTGLISWFIYTIFDRDEASSLRIQIMKEFVEDGVSETLEEIISKTRAVI